MHECCAHLNVFCSGTHNVMRVSLQPGKTDMMLFVVSGWVLLGARRQGLQQPHIGQCVLCAALSRYLGGHAHERWLYGTDFKLSTSRALVQTILLSCGHVLDHLGAARSLHLGLRKYDVGQVICYLYVTTTCVGSMGYKFPFCRPCLCYLCKRAQ